MDRSPDKPRFPTNKAVTQSPEGYTTKTPGTVDPTPSMSESVKAGPDNPHSMVTVPPWMDDAD